MAYDIINIEVFDIHCYGSSHLSDTSHLLHGFSFSFFNYHYHYFFFKLLPELLTDSRVLIIIHFFLFTLASITSFQHPNILPVLLAMVLIMQ